MKTTQTPTAIDIERPFPPTLAEFRMLNNELKRLNNSHDALVNLAQELMRMSKSDLNEQCLEMLHSMAQKALKNAEG